MVSAESGETMRSAGLKNIETICESAAVLIKSKSPSDRKLVDLIVARIVGVVSEFSPSAQPHVG